MSYFAPYNFNNYGVWENNTSKVSIIGTIQLNNNWSFKYTIYFPKYKLLIYNSY